MGKKSAPAPPDYTAAAEKTAASNLEAVKYQTQANRISQETPWGRMYYTTDPNDSNRWTQHTEVSAPLQQALDDQMSIQGAKSGLAQGMLGRLGEATQNPFDWSNMQAMGQAPQAGNLQAGNLQAGQYGPGQQIRAQRLQAGPDLQATGDRGRQRIEEGLFNRMAPQHQQAQSGLEAQLAGMGLQRGSEAWKRETQRLGDQQSRERYDAMQTAGQEQQRQFGMEQQALAQNFGQRQQAGAQNFGQQAQASQQNWLQGMQAGAQNFQQAQQAGSQNFQQQQQAYNQNFQQQLQQANYQNQMRQQQIAEQQLQRSLPLNELNALLTGSQVAQPTFSGFAQQGNAGGVDYSGAASSQFNAAKDVFGMQQAQSQGIMSGIGSIAGAAMMMSDSRLKQDVVYVGEHPIGVAVYDYTLFGQRQRGVMAQDLLLVAPHLVHVNEAGLLMVDYSGL